MAAVRLITTITPVLNASEFLPAHLASLQKQETGGVPVEIIAVDNGSGDGSAALLERTPGITVVRESRESSYAARNAGIRVARGDVLAFIDADCVPDREWLRAALACMRESGADMVAGRVAFSLRSPGSPWEVYDAVHNMDNEQAARGGSARTANLVVKRAVFDRAGFFDESATSGEDVAWSSRAVRLGFRLGYCPDAVVHHPARRALALLRKSMRTGGGAIVAGRARHPHRPGAAIALGFALQCALPPRPVGLWRRCRAHDPGLRPAQMAQIYGVAYCCKIARGLGLALRILGAPLRS